MDQRPKLRLALRVLASLAESAGGVRWAAAGALRATPLRRPVEDGLADRLARPAHAVAESPHEVVQALLRRRRAESG
jgi:hypothetical protein